MRSLLSQLLYSHLAVAAGTLLVTGLLTSLLFSQYYLAQQEHMLVAQTEQLAQTAAGLMSRPDAAAQTALLSHLASRMVNGRVCVVDLRSARMIASDGIPEAADRGLAATKLAQGEGDQPQIERTTLACMAGPVISIKMPILSPGTKSRIGTLVVRCPISEMQTTPETERGLLMVGGSAGILLAFLAALLLTRVLSRPIVAAAEASRQVAAGDFQVRLAESGPAEMRSLARSVNTMTRELAEAFERLEGERDRLRDLERMRRDFIANASHELRAPLTSIQGFIGALQDGTARTDDQRQRCIDVTLQQAAIMRRLVDQLMELSRLQGGGVKLELERLNLAEVVSGAMQGMLPQAKTAGVRLTTTGGAAFVEGDGQMLARVIGNLLDNAIRVAPSGSEILVEVAASDGRARVAVSDRGPGIPEEDLPLIWERFHKADKAHTRDAVGSGLGLAITKEIVTRHGGTVGAENRDGGGARVWFEVPMG